MHLFYFKISNTRERYLERVDRHFWVSSAYSFKRNRFMRSYINKFSTKTAARHFFKLSLCIVFFLTSCKEKGVDPKTDVFQLLKVSTQLKTLSLASTNEDLSTDAIFTIEFSSPVDVSLVPDNILLFETESNTAVSLDIVFEDEARNIIATPTENLNLSTDYTFLIADGLESEQGAEFPRIEYDLRTENGEIHLLTATVNGENLSATSTKTNVSYDSVILEFSFSEPLSAQNYQSYFTLSPSVGIIKNLSEDGIKVTLTISDPLDYYRHYSVVLSNSLTSVNGFEFEGYEAVFQTGLNSTPKFPTISDEELLTKVQEQTFKYFWDFAHPVSGLARERNTSGEVVTIGGSGFGIMSILVGIERGFITKTEGIEQLQKIVTFLENADRFHGVWPHWMNGSTGKVIPFSTQDNGADLVETAFMAQGLITVREYLDEAMSEENDLITDINALLDAIEWDWFTRGNQDVLYWHWSPEHEWAMNLPIKGYNEALIIYVLAASSKNHAIEKDVYTKGWASSGNIQNGNTFYGYNLPVGFDFGGPLFFAHYSFLGLDPRKLSDTYADYWVQNTNHSLINRAHSIENPNNYVGYSAESWGLTASDQKGGYSAHEPTRDNGTITPTAALSSMPYTPDESMEALKHFYYTLGDKLLGEYGFYDAFNPTEGWWASSYLAIDQGPIVVMIENHRSGLLWDLFMSAPEIKSALDNLGFTY